ncbi:MAG TPA: Gfo/Idh/MocA family oxidoreductase [Armatimonadota bacterium]|nr:Gfo/Idh/MocA family oxidoreductase [Armatimonadota bacterium]
MSTPLRIGIIGMGGFAMRHHDAALYLEQQGECQLICACDPAMDTFAARQEELHFAERNVRTFLDYRDMLAQYGDQLDVVTIPTPIPLHAPMHKACVDLGIPVYLEKPPTLYYTELAEMLAVEEHARKLTNVGFNFIVQEERQALKQRICSGEFGKVKRVGFFGLWPRGRNYYNRASWAGRLQLNGRLVLDSCVGNAMAHYAHDALFWAGATPSTWGEVSTVTAELYRANAIEGTDTIFTKTQIANGPEVLIAMTHSCYGRETDQEWVECENATLISGNDDNGKYIEIRWNNGQQANEIVRFNGADLVVRNFHAYFAYIRDENDRPVTRLIDSRPFVYLNDIAYIAAKHISTIPESAVQYKENPAGDIFTEITGISEIVRQFMETGALPSEQGISWATQPGTATQDDLTQLDDVIAKMVKAREEELASV